MSKVQLQSKPAINLLMMNWSYCSISQFPLWVTFVCTVSVIKIEWKSHLMSKWHITNAEYVDILCVSFVLACTDEGNNYEKSDGNFHIRTYNMINWIWLSFFFILRVIFLPLLNNRHWRGTQEIRGGGEMGTCNKGPWLLYVLFATTICLSGRPQAALISVCFFNQVFSSCNWVVEHKCSPFPMLMLRLKRGKA